MNKKAFEEFVSKILNNKVDDFSVFYTAFTHPSYDNVNNYQRLELLGDSVLNLAITQYLLERYPKKREGFITHERISYINGEVLSKVSKQLNFYKWIRLGKGEQRDLVFEKNSILADVFEAFIGALYLAFGMEFVVNWIKYHIDLFESARKGFKDYKSQLQEYLQERKLDLPVYVLEKEEGKAHDKTFYIKLVLYDKYVFTGVGKTKKSAEQNAAKKALDFLERKKLYK